MKKFILRTLIFCLPVYGVILYYAVFVKSEVTGDLGVLAEIPFGVDYQKNLQRDNLKINRVDEYDGRINQKSYDIITIGDSFSQQGIVGYQNYLAHYTDNDILNVKFSDEFPEQDAVRFLNSDCAEKFNNKVLIVESVEREFIKRLKQLKFDKRLDGDSIPVSKVLHKPDDRLMLNRTAAWIRLSFGYQNPVKNARLSTSLFSHSEKGNLLYFYNDDLFFTSVSEADILQAKANLAKLNQFCEDKGVKLIYILAADKYDVYQSFIKNNEFPANKLIDNFQNLESNYFFVNTKKVLFPFVESGVKDVYKLNDSHWSPLGHRIVAKEIHQRILQSGLL